MATLFLAIYSFFQRHLKIFWTGLALLCLGIVSLAIQIRFEEDITRFFPISRENSIAVKEAFANSKLKDKLVIMVSAPGKSPETMTAFADSFAYRIQSQLSREYIGRLLYRVEENAFLELVDELYGNLPLYLEEDDYAKMELLISDSAIADALRRDYKSLLSPSGLVTSRFIEKDPLGFSPILFDKLKQLQLDNNYELENGYIFSKDKQDLLIFITPSFDSGDSRKTDHFISVVNGVISNLHQQTPEVSAAYFGGPAVSLANARQMKTDSIVASSVSTVLILLLLYLFFRRKRIIALIFLPVIFGAGFSLALLFLIKTKVSIIAVGAGSVVLGLAINYSMHFFVHLKHTRDCKATLRDLSAPMTVGGLTTIGAFLGLVFIQSELLRDFGLFAAFSLIGSALFTLIVLPHTVAFLSDADLNKENRFERIVESVVSFRFKKNAPLLAVIVIVTVVLTWFAFDVQFEDDLMSMNYMPKDLAGAEQRLDAIDNAHLKSVFCLSYGNSLDEAASANRTVNESLKRLKSGGAITASASIADFLVPDSLQRLRIKRWNDFWSAGRKEKVGEKVKRHAEALGFAAGAFDPFFNLVNKKYAPVTMSESGALRNPLLAEFISVKDHQYTILTGIKVDESGREALFSSLGAISHVIVFDKRFIANQLVQFLQSDFNTVLYISSLLVFVFLLLSFGRIEPAVFSFLPMLLSWLWILGIMALLDIRFNIVNIIISTFIFGLGDDYSIFNSEGMLREYSVGRKMLSSFKTSILLSAVTCLIGVGTLVVAVHPALQSISLITIIGLLCVVFISFYVQPLFYEFLILARKRKGKVPLTFLSIFQSAFAFSYFFIGCVILTVLALVIYPLLPAKEKIKKRWFHNLLSLFCRSLVYIMVNVKKRIINETGEDFSVPAVVIANHQSFLDILLTVMISSKNILLVNDWVWNSPFFGLVVKRAGFYPVSKGFEESIPALEEAVKMGYSIVVFPEGTRSRTPEIHRFHKGAFFIAERFGLDILPLLIHGTSDTMQKGDDFLLKSGRLTVKFLPRIKADDASFGTGYAERTKKISRYFKSEYSRLREQLETPDYFKDRLIKNYIYKGAVLEWYMRIKLRMENNYRLFLDRVPRSGTIVDLGCGYGNVSLMLGFISKSRQVTGVDFDEEKIDIAKNAPTCPANVKFIRADVLSYEFAPADSFLLSDVLHYLPEEKQRYLILECIRFLNPGGSLLIRDADAGLSRRHRGTKLTEFFSTTFGYNKAAYGGMHFLSSDMITQLAKEHQLQMEVIDNTRLTSNVFYHLRKLPEHGTI